VVAAVAYAKSMPGLPGGDGHSGWLVTSSKGVLNLWETSRAVPGETVLLVSWVCQGVHLLGRQGRIAAVGAQYHWKAGVRTCRQLWAYYVLMYAFCTLRVAWWLSTDHQPILICGCCCLCRCLLVQCMHSQAVDFTSTKLVLEPSTKLMYGASLTSSDASECVSVHSLDVEVSSEGRGCAYENLILFQH
jgi:hypothetical protein